MSDNDVVITVSSRDKSDPNKVRANWRKTGQQIAADSRQSGEKSGAQYGEGFKVGADGKLRDSKGRFVPGGGEGLGPEGERSGRSWLGGFASSLGGGGGAKRIEGAVAGMFAISAKTAATAFSAQFVGSVVAALASGAAKLAHGLGAMAALLPAAAVAGVAAMAALKLAVVGVGDAMSAAVTGDAKEFDAAIKGLSPSARGFAREVRGMRGELKGLQQGVQQSFFEKFSGDAQRLGKTYLPMVRSALTGIAGSFGKAAHESAGFLNSSKTSGVLAMTLGHVRAAVANVAGALPSLVRAFVPLVAVGSTFLPKLTSGFKNAATELANMSEAGQKSGGIADFIQGGIDKLQSLWETAKQVGRVIGNVIDIFGEFSGVGGIFAALGIKTGGLLDSLEDLSIKAKAFFQTAAGGQAITEIFSILRSVLSATMGTLAHLATILGRTFAPVLPQLSKFAEALVNVQFALADALEPALQTVAGLLGDILPLVTSLLDLMAGNTTVMAGLAGTVIGLYAAWKIGAVAAKIAQANLNVTMAGAAGGIASLVFMSQQLSAANRAKTMDEMAEGFAAIDYAATGAAKKAILHAESMGYLDEQFKAAEESGGGAAEKLVDLMEAAGVSEEAIAEFRHEIEQAAAATDNATDAITRQRDALRALTDPVFAATDAQDRLAEAQAHVTELEKSGTATAAELQQAHEDVVRAATDNTAAQYDLGAAMASGDVDANALLATWKRQVKQGDITRADYNAQAATAKSAMAAARRAVESIPRHRATTLTARDFASAVARGVRNMLDTIPRNVTIRVGMTAGAGVGAALAAASGRAAGGISGAASGGIRSRRTWVGEQGPELLDLPPGTRVHSNPDSKRIAAESGGGPTTLVLKSDGTPLMNLLMELLRRSIKVEHGGDVQVALGSR